MTKQMTALRHWVQHAWRKGGVRRKGFIVIFFSFFLVALLVLIGLVVDTGILIASYRQAQNAADAAALAAALELSKGRSLSEAEAEATAFVRTYNGLAIADVSVSNPPAQGAYADREDANSTDSENQPMPQTQGGRYVEVAVGLDVGAFLIHVLPGVSSTNRVSARAVAGYEPPGGGEGVIVLDVHATPGLEVKGQGILWVEGSIVVNSRGSGLDQYGSWLDTGYSQYAAKATNNTSLHTRYFQVVGGVNDLDNFKNTLPDGPNPVYAGAPIVPDPLAYLPIPDTTNGVSLTMHGSVSIGNGSGGGNNGNGNGNNGGGGNGGGNGTTYLDPGIYDDIRIHQGANVVFNPGIYVLRPTSPNKGLRINGSANVTGHGVMFYVTGSNYLDNGVGYWDNLDGPVLRTAPYYQPPAPPDSNVTFATVDVNINNGIVEFTGIDDPDSPFHRMLFFFRRRNSENIQFQSNAGNNVHIGGVLYGKLAHFKLAGAADFGAQFVVNTMTVTGQAFVGTDTGVTFGVARQIFLVE